MGYISDIARNQTHDRFRPVTTCSVIKYTMLSVFIKDLNNHNKIKIRKVCNIIILILLRHDHRFNVDVYVTDTISWRCHHDRVM